MNISAKSANICETGMETSVKIVRKVESIRAGGRRSGPSMEAGIEIMCRVARRLALAD